MKKLCLKCVGCMYRRDEGHVWSGSLRVSSNAVLTYFFFSFFLYAVDYMFCLSLLVPINSPHAHNKVTSENKKRGGGQGRKQKTTNFFVALQEAQKLRLNWGKKNKFISFLFSLSLFSSPSPPMKLIPRAWRTPVLCNRPTTILFTTQWSDYTS